MSIIATVVFAFLAWLILAAGVLMLIYAAGESRPRTPEGDRRAA